MILSNEQRELIRGWLASPAKSLAFAAIEGRRPSELSLAENTVEAVVAHRYYRMQGWAECLNALETLVVPAIEPVDIPHDYPDVEAEEKLAKK